MFILHLQSSTFFKTLLCFWESQQKSRKACILRCWIQAAILKWLHSTMFLVSIVVLNLTQSVWILCIKTSALHSIPLGMWNEKWKSCKRIHVFSYLMLNTITCVISAGGKYASICDSMLQLIQEMPNLSHTLATLDTGRFKEFFECYSEFEDGISNPETYSIPVFWNSYPEMVQTLRDYKINQDRWLGSAHVCLWKDALLVSCLRQLQLCLPLLLQLGIAANSWTEPSQHIPVFQRGWIFNQTYCTKVQQSFSRSGHRAIY